MGYVCVHTVLCFNPTTNQRKSCHTQGLVCVRYNLQSVLFLLFEYLFYENINDKSQKVLNHKALSQLSVHALAC
jgi:hypothetical protein